MLAPNNDIQSVLELDRASRRWAWLRKPIVWIALVVLLLGGVIVLWMAGGTGTTLTYTTVAARRGDLTVAVSATGTVEPVNKVNVSSELSGTVSTVNVDFNDAVRAGQVLATVNTDKLKAQTNSARADLVAARASVAQAEATVTETSQTLRRVESLSSKSYMSQQNVDTAMAAYTRAMATLASAKAQVSVKEANLAAFEIDLAKAEIKSPINGVILDRQVDPGTTVAVSLSAPTLFTIAEDLRQMWVLVDIDEADAGAVSEGQHATFTVEAYTDRTFDATVIQLRYASKTTNNVVTYAGVLSVDNSDMAIRPGMTATADIVVKHEMDVLLVPNAALRYAPASAITTTTSNSNWFQNLMPRPRRSERVEVNRDVPAGRKRIWVLRDGAPQAMIIILGSSDGTFTVVAAGDLAEGDAVITDATETK